MGKLCAWSIPLSKMFIGKRKTAVWIDKLFVKFSHFYQSRPKRQLGRACICAIAGVPRKTFELIDARKVKRIFWWARLHAY
jgi:hypothetical protein